jgi:hypothetical protein
MAVDVVVNNAIDRVDDKLRNCHREAAPNPRERKRNVTRLVHMPPDELRGWLLMLVIYVGEELPRGRIQVDGSGRQSIGELRFGLTVLEYELDLDCGPEQEQIGTVEVADFG